MQERPLTNKPHDQFFKRIFSQKVRVQSFLKGALPKTIFQAIDLNSLQLISESFVDEELKESYADLVYRCRLGNGEVFLTILLEHKSFMPKFPHLQLMRYMLNIWERQKQKGKSLPYILPIVLYHGTSNWEQKEFEDYFEGWHSELQSFTPNFRYILVDLRTSDEKEIRAAYEDFILQRALFLGSVLIIRMRFLSSCNLE